MKNWYNDSVNKVIDRLDSDIEIGLNDQMVEINREKYGENKIRKPKTNNFFKVVLSQLKQIWFILVIVAFIFLAYLKYYKSSIMLMTAIIINLSIYLWLEYTEIKKGKVINNLNSRYVNVVRNGRVINLPVYELVVGDIVYIEKNTYISADLRIIESENLRINELAVTGENYEVEKFSARIEETLYNISEMRNMAFKSTVVTQGNGIGIVVETGMDTEIGKITRIINNSIRTKNNIMTQIQNIINKISIFSLLVSVIILGGGIFLRMPIKESMDFITNILLISIPFQSLLVIFSYIIIYNKLLSKDGIHFKNLYCIEQLANTSLIFTEKSSVLSKDEMLVSKIYTDNNIYNILDSKTIVKLGNNEDDTEYNVDINTDRNLARLIQAALLCNDSFYYMEDKEGKGDIDEIAMIKFGYKNNYDKNVINNQFKRVFEINYDSDKKIKTTVNKIEDKYRANVVGSIDSLLERCTHILRNGIEVEITNDDIISIKRQVYDMSQKTLITKGVAYRNFGYKPSSDENVESNLVFVGIIGMLNPLKLEAYEAIQFCKQNNIKMVVSTDENKIATYAVGKELGLTGNNKNVISSAELEFIDEQEFRSKVDNRNIFSMIDVKQKTKIINIMKEKKHTIASFGYKLTHLPYMEISDLSVAIGSNCSKIIKKTSDIYMEKIDIIKFLDLVKESKQIIKTIANILSYLITCASAGMGLILFSFVVNRMLPINHMYAIWVNLLILTISSIAIIINFKNINYTDSNKKANIIDKINLNKFVMIGLFIASISLIAFLFESRFKVFGGNLAFIVLGICEILFTFNFSDGKILFKNLKSNLLVLLNLLIVVFIITL